ncbi:SDR family NAD(P)-dependent oxidoreductase [Cryomorpha ignava]|uniref:SDR family NAD(P)-dependent oxidoreductase n=1 Tax=Cryomorpha ignava TaxID=101383 RepID=A0A7K3WP02_9FLAO|nr:SDR family NAD(P)-dependent oxidoreductase [Cryomorpha ignava]NEN22761.1 SDR family NAD(P)-dependent oxidoreductase [Cryomorpha ignava]
MKTALITGASSGFGKAIATAFARKGYRLIITGRRNEKLEALKPKLMDLGAKDVLLLSFDIQDKEAVNNAVDSLSGEWKNIDILINNAGLAVGKSTIENGEIDDWERMINTNVKGLLYMTRALIATLKNSDGPHIVNIGSIAGTEVYPGGNVYCASKHAVNALSKAMRIELLPYAIRVSQIRPGLAETEFSVVRYKGDETKAADVYKGYEPLLAEDVARAVEFVVDQPKHVCINDLEITPTAQANAYLIEKNG